jgi:hypothetical protein
MTPTADRDEFQRESPSVPVYRVIANPPAEAKSTISASFATSKRS